MDVKTAWLKPPAKSGGLDHLGIQQTPIRIFSTLLPGLTVVTDRVACYSFYPWLVWAYLDEKAKLGLDFVTTLRRAECLFTLIAEHHARSREEHVALHSRGLVGRSSLTPALGEDAPRPIPLAELATLRRDNEASYFKSKPLSEIAAHRWETARAKGIKFACSLRPRAEVQGGSQ